MKPNGPTRQPDSPRDMLPAAGERRASERIPYWTPVSWRLEDQPALRRAVLVSASQRGLSLLTDPRDTPPVGRRIRLGSPSDPWPRVARVIRVDRVAGTTSRVAAEFEEPPASEPAADS
jgi:hypothetical protein